MTTTELKLSRVYLLRHAKAAPVASGGRDFDRELDDRGYGEAEIVTEKAVDSGYRPGLIISSTAVRCRQTAEAMHRALTGECDIQMVDEIYNGNAGTYLSLLGAQEEVTSVMLVGHNPSIEETLEKLVGRDALRAALPGGYPTAGLAVIDRSDEGWVLHEFLRP